MIETIPSTPAVYIREKDAFGRSMQAVPTAVPAFIGYTEKAILGNESLKNKPIKIRSLAQFEELFGGAPNMTGQFSLEQKKAPASGFKLTFLQQQTGGNPRHYLYQCLRLFYANGGDECYIISVGDYSEPIDQETLSGTLKLLRKEQEPTMLLIPDAMSLGDKYTTLATDMLDHCKAEMNRVAILDVINGNKERDTLVPKSDIITKFRESVGIDPTNLRYGVAYYPWLHTSIINSSEVNYSFLDSKGIKTLQSLLKEEASNKSASDQTQELIASLDPKKYNANSQATFMNSSPLFVEVMEEMREVLNLLPPAAAMAGIYTTVDNNRGIQVVPANINLRRVLKPSVKIDDRDQVDLNKPLDGKAVNAIRSFIGKGVLVWGARTLDGNSHDWRYINVRRTMIMLEQSVKQAAKPYLFAPNVANTWLSVKSVISNFLTSMWQAGVLVGGSPEEAYSVEVGLGNTMDDMDILEGVMRVSVKVAISRPAEFIIITFQQQMQQS